MKASLRDLPEQFVRDTMRVWRGLRRAPVFMLAVVITLAVGIGANAAVLGVIDTMFFRKLPVPRPERVIGIYGVNIRDRHHSIATTARLTSAPDFRDLRSRVGGVTGLAAYGMMWVNAGNELAGESVWTAFVSANYFDVLQVGPQIGRVLRADEEEPLGEHPVVVISDFIWRTKFGADRNVVGHEIPIGRKSFTIIGVAPPGFTGVHPEGRTNLWIPYTMKREADEDSIAYDSRGVRNLQVIGRLAAGTTLDQVNASVGAAAQWLRETYPASDSLVTYRAEVRDRLTTYELSPAGLWGFSVVWAMVALLHLVACSNVTSLMLARAAARRTQLGIRLCLGASRSRVIVEAITESALLALLGAAGGLLVGRWISEVVARMQFLSASDAGFDARTVGVVALVSAATVFIVGLFPAIEASRSDPLAVLRNDRGVRVSRAGRRRDHSEILLVVQAALSLMLLANAAAFIQLFAHQTGAEPGYDIGHLLIASVPARSGRTTPADWQNAYDASLGRIRAIPGVRGAAAAQGAPLFHTQLYGELQTPGRPSSPDDRLPTSLQTIGPGYFEAIGTPLVRGREFTSDDRTTPGKDRDDFDVVIVNEALARRYWPGDEPLGKRLELHGSTATVVGVVKDSRDVSTVGSPPRAYFPLLESRYASFDIVLRTRGEPQLVIGAVISALAATMDGSRPTIRSMSSVREDALSLSKAASSGLAICGGIALLLTSVGLYGVVAMWAEQRRTEIGIRLALGSPLLLVHRLLIGGVARLVATAAVIGLVCAFGLVQIERSWLGGILSLGPGPVLGSLLTLASIGFLAALVPSLRAVRVSPVDVLRAN